VGADSRCCDTRRTLSRKSEKARWNGSRQGVKSKDLEADWPHGKLFVSVDKMFASVGRRGLYTLGRFGSGAAQSVPIY